MNARTASVVATAALVIVVVALFRMRALLAPTPAGLVVQGLAFAEQLVLLHRLGASENGVSIVESHGGLKQPTVRCRPRMLGVASPRERGAPKIIAADFLISR